MGDCQHVCSEYVVLLHLLLEIVYHNTGKLSWSAALHFSPNFSIHYHSLLCTYTRMACRTYNYHDIQSGSNDGEEDPFHLFYIQEEFQSIWLCSFYQRTFCSNKTHQNFWWRQHQPSRWINCNAWFYVLYTDQHQDDILDMDMVFCTFPVYMSSISSFHF